MDGSLYEKGGKQKRHHLSGPITGEGILNIVGEVKTDGTEETITQSGVEVYEGATLKTNAADIHVSDLGGFYNDGTLYLTGLPTMPY